MLDHNRFPSHRFSKLETGQKQGGMGSQKDAEAEIDALQIASAVQQIAF
ncbi:MAG: hypothetical protein ABSH48_03230 [Verrucomicrobiota bacterium]|jgi:hypothetical protein